VKEGYMQPYAWMMIEMNMEHSLC